jgi:2-dehydro-3-deoxyphosphogluconate aldolase/(4S)-4-hydroxy-2-oxoglutarate aldolase
MKKREIMDALLDGGVIAVIRLDDEMDLSRVMEAVQKGGIRAIEVTLTTPGALRAIETAAAGRGEDPLLGAGTILDAATARQAILAGAQFVVSPTVELDVIETARRYGKVAVCGAMTPTEILAAYEAGADFVKVFPANVLGPEYLRAIRGPLPQVPLVPTGGVTADNARDFIRAGAAILCVGGWLVEADAICETQYDLVLERARLFVAVVRKARKEMEQ